MVVVLGARECSLVTAQAAAKVGVVVMVLAVTGRLALEGKRR
jgi:hypothetical protein